MAFERNVSREDIECPGDTISYRCSVQSNSETVQLSWMVTFPGQEAITMSYIDNSYLNSVVLLDVNVSTTLTQYIMDEFIESEIVLTVLQNISMNGTLLECRSEDLASKNLTVFVNTSGKSSIIHKT